MLRPCATPIAKAGTYKLEFGEKIGRIRLFKGRKMNLPTREECLLMLREHKNPENIIEHSIKVSEVAIFISKKYPLLFKSWSGY